MNKFNEKLSSPAGKFVITAELFPPRGTDIKKLLAKADMIGPVVDGINVTDNQRAAMRLSSLSVCRLIKEKGFEPIMQMTCRDRNRIALQSDLLGAYVLGIENVLILSGDHPASGEYKDAKTVYDLDPVQLLSAARKLEKGEDLMGNKLNGSPKFCLGAVLNPTIKPDELQILMMEKKFNAGAQFFQTQPIFNVEEFRVFYDKVKHVPAKVLAGVTLLKSLDFVNFLCKIPGVSIPDETVKRIANSSDQLREGINICAETIRELKKFAGGIHIMAIGMEDQIPAILDKI
jgi:methylenetetrahydrofolate reductase (NADPH)